MLFRSLRFYLAVSALLVSYACRTSSYDASQAKIVGGFVVADSERMRAVTVGFINKTSQALYCSGTLIGGNTVLTAAHCPAEQGDLISFGFGRNIPGAVVEVVASLPHACYKSNKEEFDVRVVQFRGAIPTGFGPSVPLIDAAAVLPVGESVVAAGFGQTSKKGGDDGKLRAVALEVFLDRSYSPKILMLSAPRREAGKSACHGDSGGPAFVRQESHLVVAGIARSTDGDSNCDDLSGYTDVRAHRSWIQQAAVGIMTDTPPREKIDCSSTIDETKMPPVVDDAIRGPDLCRLPRGFDHTKIFATVNRVFFSNQGNVVSMSLPGTNMSTVTLSVPATATKLSVCTKSQQAFTCDGPSQVLQPILSEKGRSCYSFQNEKTEDLELLFKAEGNGKTPEPIVVKVQGAKSSSSAPGTEGP